MNITSINNKTEIGDVFDMAAQFLAYEIGKSGCYRPQKKFAKVMFLQVSVCPHRGGMHGFIQGVCMVLFRGVCMVLFGGHAWFYLGGMHGFIQGACMVFPGGHAWFFRGGVHGFSRGVCMVFPGACMVFPVFSDTMRYGQ